MRGDRNSCGNRRSTSMAAALCAVALAGGACSAPAADETAKSAPVDDRQRRELLKAFAAEFVAITPGKGKFPQSFTMGDDHGPESERPAHIVTLERPFFIAKYEVPQNLYRAVIGSNPSVWGGPRNSVEMVMWRDAVLFCRRATVLLREQGLIEPTEEIRLPTEAEWEYCCRAGTKTPYSFGTEATAPGDQGRSASRLDAYAWHTGNAAGNDPPVGALKPNAWGLYDMHGYLWEYVSDAWHSDYEGAPADSTAWDSEGEHAQRVIRGGSWRDRYDLLRSTTRWAVPDHARSDAIGFRCVKAEMVVKP